MVVMIDRAAAANGTQASHLSAAVPSLISSERDRWAAVVARDARADGVFFYSVRTTGVYCKPSCAARLPRRENVAFHDTAAAAERAGFRACKRCRPNEDASTAIRFGYGDSSLGTILVAAGGKGVCAILLGDDPILLEHELQARFPDADLVGGSGKDVARLMSEICRFIDAPAANLDVPLDLRGTPLQRRVWQELRAIPAGETASYADIARRIGKPKAVRAVARACAANPIAVAIPCHRVVRSDGGLSGYRWGIERKRALLAREAAACG